jgi:hypothetical protein
MEAGFAGFGFCPEQVRSGAIMYAPATATSLTDEMVVLLGAAGIGGQILCFF